MSETTPITTSPETEEARKQAIWDEVQTRAEAEGLSAAEQVQLYNELNGSEGEPESPAAAEGTPDEPAEEPAEGEAPAPADGETGPETPEAFRAILLNAVGATVMSRIPDAMLARLQTQANLRATIDNMNENNYGPVIEGDEARMNRLVEIFNRGPAAPTQTGERTAPTTPEGRTAQGERAEPLTKKEQKRLRKRQKWIQEYRENGVPEDEIEAKVDRKERWRQRGRRAAIGAAAIAGVVGSVFAVKYGIDHHVFDIGKGDPNDIHKDGAINPADTANNISGRQLAEQLNVQTPPLEHVNDFWNSPNFLGSDSQQMAAEMDKMLRSNPNIAAMWASQLHMQVPAGVTGMPEIPPLPDMNDASAVTAYGIKVNQLGDWLAQNHEAYMKLEQNMVEAFKTAQAGDITTADNFKTMGAGRKLGYAFAGAKPSGPGQIPQSFLDTDTTYANTKARVWMINGEAYEIQDCGQRRWINVRHYAPVQQYAPVVSHTQEVVTPRPPVYQPPVEQPPVGPPPVGPPPELPPVSPPVPEGPPPYVKGTELGNQFDSQLFNPILKPIQQTITEQNTTLRNGTVVTDRLHSGSGSETGGQISTGVSEPHPAGPTGSSNTSSAGSAETGRAPSV